MALSFEWTAALSVGDETIDKQHQQLFDQTNQILSVMIGEDPHPEKVAEVLDFLSQYIEKHFSFEEEYMRLHDYPDRNEHRALHQYFSDQYAKLKRSIDPRYPTMESVISLENFLGQWLINHIGEEDKKYHDFIERKKLSVA